MIFFLHNTQTHFHTPSWQQVIIILLFKLTAYIGKHKNKKETLKLFCILLPHMKSVLKFIAASLFHTRKWFPHKGTEADFLDLKPYNASSYTSKQFIFISILLSKWILMSLVQSFKSEPRMSFSLLLKCLCHRCSANLTCPSSLAVNKDVYYCRRRFAL